MAAEVSARKLLLEVRNDFNSCVDADSLIAVLELHKMIKKKEKKFLGRPNTDENTKNTLLFHKMYNSEETSSPLSATEVIRLLEETKNERNILFSKTMQSILSTIARATAASLPPFKYHCPLDDNPSAIFSSTGGVLYSPVYGVTVYIPAGAILGEEQVEVSFRLITDEAEIQELTSHSVFEGSVLCSGVFEFGAKLVDASDGEEFTMFHSDVWIELPHCLSFGGCSLKDYSTAFAVSERSGKVEVEEQALFSEGYPYFNLPVRHFSKFGTKYTQKKRFKAAPYIQKAMQRLSIANSFDEHPSASPHASSQLLRLVSQEAAPTSIAAERRGLYQERRTASNEASAEEHHQDASDSQGDDDDTMEVDQPTPAYPATSTSLEQEALNKASMSIMARVYQPRKRSKLPWWTADLVFAPHLHNTYKTLADFQEWDQFECYSTVFHLELQTQLIQLKSGPPTQGWSVELSTTKILLEHLEKVAPLLGEPKYSSKMADFLPKSTATVQNHGTSLPLRHPIEVESSHPPTRCYLASEPVLDEVGASDETLDCSQCHPQHGPMASTSGSAIGPSLPSSTPEGPMPSGNPPTPFSPLQTAAIQWERDRYILALLSIRVPEDQLAAFGESLGLQQSTIDQVTALSAVNVGERAYEMLRRAIMEQALTFGKILVSLDGIDRSNELVPILRSYLQSFNMATSGTLAVGNFPNRFLVWLRVNHPTLIPLTGIERKRIISPGRAERDSLFLYLSPKLVCVWRMVGRMLGLTDSDIAEIDAAHNSQHDRESEPCHQMLLKWVEHTQNPSDITYYKLMAALQLTSRGTGAANDAIFYLRDFALNLTSTS